MICTYAPDISPWPAIARRSRSSGHAWTLAHRPEAAADARRITQAVLAQWRVADEAADSVLLTVSELVSNAVEHAEPPLRLRLSRAQGARRVRIEVCDGGPAAAQGDWAASCTRGEHGRGLQIIDRLTVAHGDRAELGHAIHWADVAIAA
ncbi:ATP-binding protein [Kitasatospora kifunensis]|uniref:Anti-sigma regulatory factor (Ser/Thr protein kinase) n=1 Tax=Kitasatospora kifunensis TaxID=58351 RepID=A0A7W7RAF5_KITKI|nr:ATP-binding protein [Kitasatospora kifunensis]MBB4928420.1 anti-sigma regulatory factor (Ser/Thr protein kinase) [Kitasatospora kifunensis]